MTRSPSSDRRGPSSAPGAALGRSGLAVEEGCSNMRLHAPASTMQTRRYLSGGTQRALQNCASRRMSLLWAEANDTPDRRVCARVQAGALVHSKHPPLPLPPRPWLHSHLHPACCCVLTNPCAGAVRAAHPVGARGVARHGRQHQRHQRCGVAGQPAPLGHHGLCVRQRHPQLIPGMWVEQSVAVYACVRVLARVGMWVGMTVRVTGCVERLRACAPVCRLRRCQPPAHLHPFPTPPPYPTGYAREYSDPSYLTELPDHHHHHQHPAPPSATPAAAVAPAPAGPAAAANGSPAPSPPPASAADAASDAPGAPPARPRVVIGGGSGGRCVAGARVSSAGEHGSMLARMRRLEEVGARFAQQQLKDLSCKGELRVGRGEQGRGGGLGRGAREAGPRRGGREEEGRDGAGCGLSEAGCWGPGLRAQTDALPVVQGPQSPRGRSRPGAAVVQGPQSSKGRSRPRAAGAHIACSCSGAAAPCAALPTPARPLHTRTHAALPCPPLQAATATSCTAGTRARRGCWSWSCTASWSPRGGGLGGGGGEVGGGAGGGGGAGRGGGGGEGGAPD